MDVVRGVEEEEEDVELRRFLESIRLRANVSVCYACLGEPTDASLWQVIGLIMHGPIPVKR